jgi:hypothetical protein
MVHQLMIDSGNYISMDIISSFCELISESPELQPHAVERLNESLGNFSDNQTLVQVASFVIGEFATQEGGAIDSLTRVIVLPQTVADTKMYIITALAKLAARFGKREAVAEHLVAQIQSNDLEVQQRAGEMMKVLGHVDVCEEMLAPIAKSSAQVEHNPLQIVESQQTQVQAKPVDDLLLLVLDDTSSTDTSVRRGRDDLLDLLGDSLPVGQTPVQAPVPNVQAPVQSAPGPAELFRTSEVICLGQTKANPANASQVALRLFFFSTGQPMNEFVAEHHVGPDWKMTVQPADGKMVIPADGKPVSQILYLMSPANAQLQLQVKMKYRYGAQPLSGTAMIRQLPI